MNLINIYSHDDTQYYSIKINEGETLMHLIVVYDNECIYLSSKSKGWSTILFLFIYIKINEGETLEFGFDHINN